MGKIGERLGRTGPARRREVAPEALALNALRERFLAPATPVEPQEEWERRLLPAARA
jgi:hypothetical protein